MGFQLVIFNMINVHEIEPIETMGAGSHATDSRHDFIRGCENLRIGKSEEMSQNSKSSQHSIIRDYLRRIGMFSRNARLFLSATFLNGLAMGIWTVLFNLYLLDLGFRENFIGQMLLLGGLAAGLAAFPAGIVCDKIGRKRTLLTGIALGSVFNAILVFTSNPVLLLIVNLFQGFEGLTSILFWVAQIPFMMENSMPEERTHLFSINLATWFLSNMAGSYIGGVLPGVFSILSSVENENVVAYRAALTISVVLLFLALLPYYAIKEKPYQKNNVKTSRLSLEAIQSRAVIGKLVFTSGMLGLGAGLILPFFNVFFKNKLQASPEQIGIIFATGNMMAAVSMVLAPVVSGRLGKVRAVALTQLSSIPFIFGIAFSPNLGFAAVSYLARGALMVTGAPIYQNFAMEVVQTEERATTSGFINMADRIPRALASSISGQMMTGGNYVLPYMITSAFYFFGGTLFIIFFHKIGKAR